MKLNFRNLGILFFAVTAALSNLKAQAPAAAPAPATAAPATAAPTTTTKPKHDHAGNTIIIDSDLGSKANAAANQKVFIDSGTLSIAGEPEDSLKRAYRAWDQRCTEWKNEMKRNNRQNLILADCGAPTHSQESAQLEKTYTYKSTATYKIRIANK